VKVNSTAPSGRLHLELWQRSHTMLPIPGTSSVKHLEENVAGATIKLSPEEFEAIDTSTR